VPEGENCYFVTANSVIEPVANASQEYTLYGPGSCVERGGTNVRLNGKQRKRFRQFVIDGAGSVWAILFPP
jgi:hypothetical protein